MISTDMYTAVHLDRSQDAPLYRQLYQQLRELILTGALQPGQALPPTRALADQLQVGRVTVMQAYDQLHVEGYVTTRTGAGTFVADLPTEDEGTVGAETAVSHFTPQLTTWGRRIMANHAAGRGARTRPEIDFGFGRSFPHIFPYDVWRRLLARYLSTDDVMLSRYGSVAGFAPLRQALADHLSRLRGVRATPEQVVIVSGAQQALDILTRLLLRPGDEVLVETPGYNNAFALFRTNGARLRGLPVDDDGFPVELVPADCPAQMAFVTPSNQFPRGGSMPLPRRLSLLQWAQNHGALIVEDDYDGELRYDAHPLAALQSLDEHGHVVYLGTFSKVLFPALRLGYVVLPPQLVAPFVRAKGLVDRGAPTLTQAAVADFIAEGHFERHLKHLRRAYGERREVLVAALARYLKDRVRYAAAPAGLHVMLYLETAVSEPELIQRAADAGVGIYPGAPYHLQTNPPPSILLGFSGLGTEEIEEGIRRLGTILKRWSASNT